MKRRYILIALIVALVMVWGCAEKMTEEQLRAQALDFENKEQWEEAVTIYNKLLKTYPESKRADETLYKLGVIYANNLKDFNSSIESYQKLVEKFPNSNWVIQSSFMIGYRYANDINDLEKARDAYEQFLKKWPNHELATSVRWELEHLGQDVSEIELQLGNPEGSGEN